MFWSQLSKICETYLLSTNAVYWVDIKSCHETPIHQCISKYNTLYESLFLQIKHPYKADLVKCIQISCNVWDVSSMYVNSKIRTLLCVDILSNLMVLTYLWSFRKQLSPIPPYSPFNLLQFWSSAWWALRLLWWPPAECSNVSMSCIIFAFYRQ